jgi:hypothetical protein
VSAESKKFVIQKHVSGDDIHWDFMLESGDCLQTWRLEKNPADVVSHSVEAVKIFDHPPKFLTYEGSVNEGKGHVKIADAGTYTAINKDDKSFELDFNDQILKGKFTLTHIKEDKWRFSPRV